MLVSLKFDFFLHVLERPPIEIDSDFIQKYFSKRSRWFELIIDEDIFK